MISNGAILLQVGEDLIRFSLHLPPQMPPQTKNGLRLLIIVGFFAIWGNDTVLALRQLVARFM